MCDPGEDRCEHGHRAVSWGWRPRWCTTCPTPWPPWSREQRLIVDDELASRLARMDDRETQLQAQRLVMRMDEDGVLRRRARALTRRRVTSRRLGDAMAQITAVLSDLHHAAVMNSLTTRASALKAGGDERSRSQIITDLFVTRLTGQVTAAPAPVPASIARKLVLAAPVQATRVRRLFRFEDNGRLVAMEARRVQRRPGVWTQAG